jgi:hypothetical protein
MRTSPCLALLTGVALAAASSCHTPRPHLFSNPPADTPEAQRIPTVHESAVQARRILSLTPLGTLSTVFPRTASVDHDAPDGGDAAVLERRPGSVSGAPIGLMDYFADCEPDTGNPTILAINIATSFKNVDAGSNITLSMHWTPPDSHKKRYSAAALPRFSLVGYLEDIEPGVVESARLAKCFTETHFDAKWWLPGNPIHDSRWVRLVVKEVYWIGGFGDRAYIGWIPKEEWSSVTREEIDQIRLPGEQSRGWFSGWFESFEL